MVTQGRSFPRFSTGIFTCSSLSASRDCFHGEDYPREYGCEDNLRQGDSDFDYDFTTTDSNSGEWDVEESDDDGKGTSVPLTCAQECDGRRHEIANKHAYQVPFILANSPILPHAKARCTRLRSWKFSADELNAGRLLCRP